MCPFNSGSFVLNVEFPATARYSYTSNRISVYSSCLSLCDNDWSRDCRWLANTKGTASLWQFWHWIRSWILTQETTATTGSPQFSTLVAGPIRPLVQILGTHALQGRSRINPIRSSEQGGWILGSVLGRCHLNTSPFDNPVGLPQKIRTIIGSLFFHLKHW